MARDPQAGVTLVEVLVVLVLVGVMAGAIGLRVGDRDAVASAETRAATRLAVQLTEAATEALATGTAQYLIWDADGYQLSGSGDRRIAARISTAPGQYPITPDLLPDLSGPLRLTLGPRTVMFDGARAFVLPEGS